MPIFRRGRCGAGGRGTPGVIESLEARSLFAGGEPFVEVSLGVNAAVADAVVQGDGRIVLCGYTKSMEPAYSADGPGARDFFVARLNADLSLDGSFGAGGVALVDVWNGKNHNEAAAVMVQDDGKILAAGEQAKPGHVSSTLRR